MNAHIERIMRDLKEMLEELYEGQRKVMPKAKKWL
jgi:hypothetical protein